MFAVVATGGKQYRVGEGDLVRVEKLAGDVGAAVVLEQVLMVGGNGAPKIGRPALKGAKVEATIVGQRKTRKIIVFKMRHRKNLRRKYGHRQPFTELRINKIVG